jgi:hypothetical protein
LSVRHRKLGNRAGGMEQKTHGMRVICQLARMCSW